MCMMVYVASDRPLPRIPWDKSKPAFCVSDLHECYQAVRKHFSKTHICYVGAHTGCGCGFQTSDDPEEDDPESLAAAQRSRASLAEFLRSALKQEPSLELYACWADDEACDPEHRGELVPDDLLSSRIRFLERELLTIVSKRSDQP